MFGFLIKKAFFDFWDNLYRVFLLNLGFLVLGSLVSLAFIRSLGNPALSYAILLPGAALLFVYTGAASRMVREISDYGQPGFRDFLEHLAGSWLASLLFFAVNALLIFLLGIAFQVYGGMQSFLGLLAAALLFWAGLVWAFACQFFFPIQSRLDRRFLKSLKKMLPGVPGQPTFLHRPLPDRGAALRPVPLHRLPAPRAGGRPAVGERRLQAAVVQVRLAGAAPGKRPEAGPLGGASAGRPRAGRASAR